MNLLYRVLEETYRIVLDSGVFILLGFFLAGVLHEFVDPARIGRVLGGRDLKSILMAALVGAPLPLCSCGVLPTALALRKKGASREATVSFLISTPETGVDSVAITYGLLGPVMALVRPLAAVATAVAAGLLSLVAGGDDSGAENLGEADSAAPEDAAPACHDGSCAPAVEVEAPRRGLKERIVRIGRYAFVTMMDELAFWLLLAFVATGLLAALLPVDFFLRFLPWPLLSMVVMAAVGVPTYVCASASTPIAAAMIGKGLDPGAALVFMLTGPATNASTIAVVARMFGRRFVALYLAAIFGVAIGAGLLLDAVIGAGIVPTPVAPEVEARGLWALVRFLGAFGFLALLAFSLQRRGLKAGWNELKGHVQALGELVRGAITRGPSRRSLAIAGASCVALLWAWSALLVVRPGETGLVRTLGKVTSANLGPGLHLVPPFPFGKAEAVPTSLLRSVEVGFRYRVAGGAASAPLTSRVFVPAQSSRLPEEAQFLTGDENVIEVAAVVHYRVADPALYRFGVDRAEPAFRDLARAFLVEEVGRTPIDAIYTSERGTVERRVLEELRQSPALRETGLAPVDLRLLFVHAPDDVHGAFRDIASAAEDRTTAQNKALVAAEGALGQARGEAARTLAEADSERTRLVDTAQGDAAAFVPLAREVAAAPQTSRMRLKLEALERVLPGVPKLIRPDARRAPGFELWITPEGSAGSPGPAAGSAPLPGLSGFVNPIPTPSPDIPAAER